MTADQSPHMNCRGTSEGDAVGGVEQRLLELARQLAQAGPAATEPGGAGRTIRLSLFRLDTGIEGLARSAAARELGTLRAVALFIGERLGVLAQR